MKQRKWFLIACAVVAALLMQVLVVCVGLYCFASVPVPLTEITSIPLTDDIFVDPGGTWWLPCEVGENSGVYRDLGEQVHNIALRNIDAQSEMLIVSWGRPLHSVQYRRVTMLAARYGNYFIAEAIFENAPQTQMLYIYKAPKTEIYDSYSHNVCDLPEPVLYSE